MTGYVQNVGGYSDLDSLYAAYNYTPAFRGSYVTQPDTTHVAEQIQTTVPMATYSAGPSTAGLVAGLLTAGAGVATLCYASKRGKGEGVIQGFKNIWHDITGKGAKAASEAASATSDAAKPLSEIKIIYKNGEFKCYIPGGEKASITNSTEIQNFLKEHPELKRLQAIKPNGGTKITEGTFTFEGNTIKFKDGKITEFTNKSGSHEPEQLFLTDKKLDFSKTGLSDQDKDFMRKLDEAFTSIRNADGDFIRSNKIKLTDFTYTTSHGDYEATVHFAKEYGALNVKREVKEIKIPNAYEANSDKVLSYRRQQREAGNTTIVEALSNLGKQKKVPEGFKVDEFVLSGGSYSGQVRVKNGEIFAIKDNEKWYLKGSEQYNVFLENNKNEEKIKKEIEKALQNGKIPEGATIIPA